MSTPASKCDKPEDWNAWGPCTITKCKDCDEPPKDTKIRFQKRTAKKTGTGCEDQERICAYPEFYNLLDWWRFEDWDFTQQAMRLGLIALIIYFIKQNQKKNSQVVYA